MILHHFLRFEDYKSDDSAPKAEKLKVMDSIKAKRPSAQDASLRIYVQLPLREAHTFHVVSEQSGLSNRVHPEIVSRIKEYVSNGITSAAVIRKLLKAFVEKDLCRYDKVKPSTYDRAYYPWLSDVRNHIHKSLKAGDYSGFDQDNLEQMIRQWKVRCPDEKIFFRKCGTQEECTESAQQPQDTETDCEEDTKPSDSILFVHQDAWQQQLLLKYGNTMSLIDATHKTTKYALPLFLIVVRTNVGYIPVAEFIAETESTASITEALAVLKSWNPEWNPSYFMMDYSEAERQAVSQTFPDTIIYICSFHREQAWERWSKTGNLHILNLVHAKV